MKWTWRNHSAVLISIFPFKRWYGKMGKLVRIMWFKDDEEMVIEFDGAELIVTHEPYGRVLSHYVLSLHDHSKTI